MKGQAINIANKLTKAIATLTKEQQTAEPIKNGSLNSAMTSFEDSIRGNTTETGAVFDSSGKEVWRNGGGVAEVDIQGFLDKFSWSERSNKTLTHNHPARTYNEIEEQSLGGSFSGADIGVFIAHNLKSMRAVDDKYDYEIRRPNSKKYNIKNDFDESPETSSSIAGFNANKEFFDRYTIKTFNLDKQIREEFSKFMEQEVQSPVVGIPTALIDVATDTQVTSHMRRISSDIKLEAVHEVVQELAQEYGFEYTRTERN